MDRNQLVCGCMKVTYGQLEDAVKNGASSFEDVRKATSVSCGCGRCEDKVRHLVEELLQEK